MRIALRQLWAAPLCFTAFACAGSNSPAPERAIDSTLAITVCADADEATIPSMSYGEFDLQSTGTVSEVGMGPADPCPRGRLAMRSPLSAPDPFPTTWFRIQPTQGSELLVAVAAPGFASSIQPGDVLRVAAQYRSRAWAPTNAWLELRDESGQLLFWYGEAGRVADLTTPAELQLSAGEVQARPSSLCFPVYEQKRLEVEIAGASGSIGWSEQGAVGDWLVTNFGISEEVSQSTCADAFIRSAAAAVWPLPNP
jgi:hypothetical protein